MVYLMVEQQFAKYPWCQRTIRGIFEEVRKRRIHVQEVSELPGGAEERSCVLLVGASEEWINQTAREAGSLGLHPVVLSNRETNSSGLSVSSVKMDIHSSMELAVPVAYIILDDDHRAIAVLFRANARTQVCIIQFSTKICSVHMLIDLLSL